MIAESISKIREKSIYTVACLYRVNYIGLSKMVLKSSNTNYSLPRFTKEPRPSRHSIAKLRPNAVSIMRYHKSNLPTCKG